MHTKEVFQDKMDGRLREIRQEIDTLRERLGGPKDLDDGAQRSQFETLLAKYETAEQRVQELKESGVEDWEDMKPAVSEAVEAVEQEWEQVRTKLS